MLQVSERCVVNDRLRNAGSLLTNSRAWDSGTLTGPQYSEKQFSDCAYFSLLLTRLSHEQSSSSWFLSITFFFHSSEDERSQGPGEKTRAIS